MSYEFNPESPTLELPNPYKIENFALFVSGTFMMLCGIASILGVRERISHGIDSKGMIVVGLAIGLMFGGVVLAARAMTQLRFFFGRNRPVDLAPGIPQNQDGNTEAANYWKETLRQSALTYPEPRGPLNGLLYSWLPHLIFAPRVVQVSAQAQFYNFLSLAATFLSFLLCWLIFGQDQAGEWIGVGYGLFAFFQIIKPMTRGNEFSSGPMKEAVNVGMGSLIALIVLAILGPVLLGLIASKLPSLDGLDVNGVLFVALLCILLGCGVFGLALKNQLQPPPQAIGSARVIETVTMNAHPNKLNEELDRILMARWFKNIPNRRYTRKSPQVAGQQGQFEAEMFEETQPRPQTNRTALGISHALATPQFFWLTCLTALALAYSVIGTIATVVAATKALHASPVGTTIAFAASEFASAYFCYRAAHVLWGRFDFTSELIWVELSGSFESARLNVGNQLSGAVQTSKNVVNIESMTMRVWVSEIDTVIFAKDAPRQLIGMRGLQDKADELAASLKGFGETRSMVVAPTSSNDLERAEKIKAMSEIAQGQTRPALNVEFNAAARTPIAGPQVQSESKKSAFCTACGTSIDADARFCGECGKPVLI
jgi:hypothetical protein